MADPVGDRWLVVERRKTLYGIISGNLGAAIAYGVAYALWPAGTELTRSDRLFAAIELCAFPALIVLAMFYSCARMPDTTGAVNPLLGQESLRWKVNQRVLSNTVEQIAIFVPLLLALSLRVDAAHAKVIPIHVTLWVVARIAFAVGYRRSPALRAPGMAATSAINMATIAWLVRSLVMV
jgi:uncharacterized membrane protein YecN with MAPEG domain